MNYLLHRSKTKKCSTRPRFPFTLFSWLCRGDVEIWVIGLIKDVTVQFVKEVFEPYNLSSSFDTETDLDTFLFVVDECLVSAHMRNHASNDQTKKCNLMQQARHGWFQTLLILTTISFIFYCFRNSSQKKNKIYRRRIKLVKFSKSLKSGTHYQVYNRIAIDSGQSLLAVKSSDVNEHKCNACLCNSFIDE